MRVSRNNVFTSLVDKISETTEPILMKFLPHVRYIYAWGANQRNVKILNFLILATNNEKKTRLFFLKISAILLYENSRKIEAYRNNHFQRIH